MAENIKLRAVKYAMAVFVFVLIAIFSLVVSDFVKKINNESGRTEFEILANDALSSISSEVAIYLSMIEGVKGFFEASDEVTPDEWNSYINTIRKTGEYKGVKTLSFLPHIKASELNQFITKARAQIAPDYNITPPGERERYFPIYFFTKFMDSDLTYGMDHYARQDRSNIIYSAVETGNIKATEVTRWLFNDPVHKTENGIVIYAPVFKKKALIETPEQRWNALSGVISCAVVMDVFFPDLLKGSMTNYFNLEIYLGEEISEKTRLFTLIPADFKIKKQPQYTKVIKDRLLEKPVLIIIKSTPEFEEKINTHLPSTILISGNLIGLLLAFIVGFQIKSRARDAELMEQIKKSEEILKKSKELLEQQNREKEELIKEIEFEKHMLDELMSNIPDAVYFKDINSRFIRFSKEALKKIGVKSQDEVIGKTDFDLFTEEHARPAFEDEQQIIKTGIPIIGKVEKETWIDGRVTYVLTTKMPYRDRDGKIIGTFGISKDITELKEAQENLAKEKELLEITLTSIGDAVISTDIEGRIVIMNRVAEKLTGWKKEDAIGKPLTEIFNIINAETRQPAFNPVEKVLKTGEICGLANNTVLIARDGTERIIADSAAPIKSSGGRIVGVVLVFRDVTDKHIREKEMIKAARLEMLERLASGLAHDFNNILTAIMGNVSFAKMALEPHNQVTNLLDLAEKACLHAKNITRQLLIFTKGGEPVKKPLNIIPLVKQSVQMGVYASSVIVRYDLSETPLFVDGDDIQLGQAITHLVNYSVEAMQKKGSLFVAVSKVVIGADSQKGLKGGDYVKIVIQDHSNGIEPEKLARLFEPYSSHVGLGSGLGLASSETIIRRHGGKIEVQSILNKGNVFTVYLPLTKARAETESEIMRAMKKPSGNRILIMDDEESICSLVKMILEKEGYKVDVCNSGEEAIKRYTAAKQAGVPFDLLILDLTIEGGIGGVEVIEELKKIDPDVRAVVSSGYSFDPVIANYEKYGFIGALQKPYNAKELKEFVRGFFGK